MEEIGVPVAMGVIVRAKSWLLFVFCVGCAQHHCRQAPATSKQAVSPEATQTLASTERRVMVYKYDGSLQCGQGKAIALEQMAKDLSGIKVYSQIKKADGLMHIQVCGSPTGMANVYEIAESDLAKAERHGFKKWTFE